MIPLAAARQVNWSEDLDTVRPLFVAHRDWVADHADPDPESAPRVRAGLELLDALTGGLPGAYGPPTGDVLLWQEGGNIVACGALRELAPKVGEIKRIHISPDYRGPAFGRPYVRALKGRATELGYETLRADTLASMYAAIEFYQAEGFRPISAYWPHPAAGALFFECHLSNGPKEL